MSSINFANIWLLFIAVGLIVLLTVPYVVTVNKDNRNGHNVASIILHVIIALLVGFSAAGTSIETTITETHVYVVADVSYSSAENLDTIDSYIENLSENLPKNSKLGVVVFGKNAERLVKHGESLKSVKEATVDHSATDIVGALDYAKRQCFVAGVKKRVVLISDGKQTGNADQSLKNKIDDLINNDIQVDAIYLNNNLKEDAREVQVTSVEFNKTVYRNQKTTVSAMLQSKLSTSATLALYQGDLRVSSQAVTLNPGTTSVSFTLPTEEEGEFEYHVEVSAEADSNPFNNYCSFTQTVTDVVNVLFITDEYDDARAAEALYGDPTVANLTVVETESDVVPTTLAELVEYDEIILSNLDVSKIENYKYFIENLETVVSRLGKSLIGMGNLHLQNGNDEYLTKLSDMLPVRYGNSARDSKLYTIVFDASHSMAQAGKINVAKSAATQLIGLLDEQDLVSIVVFYGEVEIHLQPTYANDSNRDTILETIDNIDSKHGTLVGAGLTQAANILNNYQGASEKQIFLISDGLNYEASNMDARATAKSLKDNGVGITVIDPGQGNAQNSSDNATSSEAVAAVSLLTKIATPGCYFPVTSQTELDETVFTKIADSFGDVIIDNRPYDVSVSRKFDDVLENISTQTLEAKSSAVNGYVNSRAKASATTVLSTEYHKAGGEVVAVPLYSDWTFGNGKAASFTSNISGAWTKNWVDNGIKDIFFKNILTKNIPIERTNAPFTVRAQNESGHCSLDVSTVEVKAGAEFNVTLTYPDGTQEALVYAFDFSTYSASFFLPVEGTYKLELSWSYKGESYSYVEYITQTYLPEYNSFTVYDASPLYKMLGGNGIVSEDGNLVIENNEAEIATMTMDLTAPLLIAAVSLFAIDIIIRKLKWNDILSLFGKVNKEGKRK